MTTEHQICERHSRQLDELNTCADCTIEYETGHDSFTAPTDSVTIVLSRERYNQLKYELNRAALFHVKQGHSDAASQHVFDLLNLITTQEG